MLRELDFSVVVPCRNEAAWIGGFLDDLTAQEGLDGLDWEILIADGQSRDGTVRILGERLERNPRIRVLTNPGRIVSTGLNRAIREARGKMIIRMDVHSRYAKDYLHNCLQVFEESGADNVGGAARARAEGPTQRAVAAAFASRFAVGGASSHFADYEGWVDTVTFGCWKKETLLRLGLFDETLVRNQDDELNLRLVRSGGRIWQSPKIRLWYEPRDSYRGLFTQYRQYGYWKVAVIRKHRIPASWRHLAPGLLAAGLILPLPLIPFVHGIRIYWSLLVGAYTAFLLAGSLRIAATAGWDLFQRILAALACFHLGYGIGFLQGLAAHAAGRHGGRRKVMPARSPEERQGPSSTGSSDN